MIMEVEVVENRQVVIQQIHYLHLKMIQDSNQNDLEDQAVRMVTEVIH